MFASVRSYRETSTGSLRSLRVNDTLILRSDVIAPDSIRLARILTARSCKWYEHYASHHGLGAAHVQELDILLHLLPGITGYCPSRQRIATNDTCSVRVREPGTGAAQSAPHGRHIVSSHSAHLMIVLPNRFDTTLPSLSSSKMAEKVSLSTPG